MWILEKMPTHSIDQFNLDNLLPNGTDEDKKLKGSQIIVIGRPKTGKTMLIKSLLFHKKHLLSGGIAMSGTESATGDYGKYFPPLFVYTKFDEQVLQNYVRRQKVLIQEVEKGTIHYENAFSVLVIDDCTDKPSALRTQVMQELYKNGRHMSSLIILALQYALDVLPNIRLNTAATFILKENNVKSRKILHDNYAGIIPTYSLFCDIMNQITDDYTALVVCNNLQTNDWKDNVFWYRADVGKLENFKLGSQHYWDFSNERYNPDFRQMF